MDHLLAPLTAAFGPLYAAGLLGIALILAVLPQVLRPKSEPFDKLKTKTVAPEGQQLRRSEGIDKLRKFSAFLEPQDAETLSAARLRARNAVRLFHFAQFALCIGFLIFGLIYTFLVSQTSEVSTQFKILATLIPGASGYYLPQYWITRRVAERQKQIIEGFPDALDLMLVCIEAGQSLDQSVNRMAKESRAVYPALADELEIVSHEVKAGKERVMVLKDMAERVNVPYVSSFVTTLVQSTTYGTSIAEALRIYSSEMRDKRVMRAEEKANTLPTKLTLGTMLFTVPPLMIILIGPSVMGISKMLAMRAR